MPTYIRQMSQDRDMKIGSNIMKMNDMCYNNVLIKRVLILEAKYVTNNLK